VGHGKAGLEKLPIRQAGVMADIFMKQEPLSYVVYQISCPESGWPTLDQIPSHMKAILRPMAETLAMLDGNAFFGYMAADGSEWYEQYLPEAWAVFQNNGGMEGWAGEASFVYELNHENTEIAEAYESWRVLKSMYHE
jgi:hypothetical protein